MMALGWVVVGEMERILAMACVPTMDVIAPLIHMLMLTKDTAYQGVMLSVNHLEDCAFGPIMGDKMAWDQNGGIMSESSGIGVIMQTTLEMMIASRPGW